MGDWEIDIQLSSGAVRGGMGLREYPIAFNTGQVIMGWTALYQTTRMSRFMEAATRAAEWLLSIQDRDGKWSKHTYMSRPHAYHTRVAWALIQLFACTGDEKYKTAAQRQISWTIDQATENGWIGQMGFNLEDPPSTHTIAYTLRGLLETSSLLRSRHCPGNRLYCPKGGSQLDCSIRIASPASTCSQRRIPPRN